MKWNYWFKHAMNNGILTEFLWAPRYAVERHESIGAGGMWKWGKDFMRIHFCHFREMYGPAEKYNKRTKEDMWHNAPLLTIASMKGK